ncbi:MAG: glycoside hydrolase family 92 protein, partial [Cytophagales bacterium]|nr:glycoside hydrolase family 92 protein [Cytophagales bacterium]
PGEKFTIRAENNGQKNVYIQSASLNAKAWNSYRLTHETVSNGGELVLTLGPEPNKAWGINPVADRGRE